MRPAVALTIAGSDSGGGAGIQADLKTFAAHGVFGTSAVTAVTAQNTVAVTGIEELSPKLVGLQIDAVVSDIGVDAVKTGMLSSRSLIEIVARKLEEHRLVKTVVDPVMVAKSGARLLDPAAVEALAGDLLPRALVVTPNLPEAESFVGFPLEDEASILEAAKRIVEMGAKAALVKGGHGKGAESVDVLYYRGRFRHYRGPRIPTKNTHGTGCTFSAAIAAELALDRELEEAVERAKGYVTRAISEAFELGKGHGPLNHFPSGTRVG
ncbi:MAG TPA: bifunctional hydroxymethylpyrimidine kinase/phosphomethylpyrimidine kinase [Vicinamibacteria bacterium]|nr:bifunctional hydroxymethylpyrimidine kinase/phosphomethylpyrimidine kinase [Vicinamibacteria bacterium]